MQSNLYAYEQAYDWWKRIMRLSDEFIAGAGTDPAMRSAITESAPRGLYEYWKSGDGGLRLYLVADVSIETDTHMPFVQCFPLCLPHSGKSVIWPLLNTENGFLVPIGRTNVYTGPRFRLIEPLGLREIMTLGEHALKLSRITDSAAMRAQLVHILRRTINQF